MHGNKGNENTMKVNDEVKIYDGMIVRQVLSSLTWSHIVTCNTSKTILNVGLAALYVLEI